MNELNDFNSMSKEDLIKLLLKERTNCQLENRQNSELRWKLEELKKVGVKPTPVKKTVKKVEVIEVDDFDEEDDF